MTDVKRLKIWTDGGCSPNPGRGSWSYVTDDLRYGSGVEEQSTNNRMELMAAIAAIEACGEVPLLIATDSDYLAHGATNRLIRFIQMGFKTRKGKDVQNADLWRRLAQGLSNSKGVKFQWIPRDSEEGNRRADAMATLVRWIET